MLFNQNIKHDYVSTRSLKKLQSYLLSILTIFVIITVFESESHAQLQKSSEVAILEGTQIVQLKNAKWNKCLVVEGKGPNRKYRVDGCNSAWRDQVFTLRRVKYRRNGDVPEFHLFEIQNLWSGGYFMTAGTWDLGYKIQSAQGGTATRQAYRVFKLAEKSQNGKKYVRIDVVKVNTGSTYYPHEYREHHLRSLSVPKEKDKLTIESKRDFNQNPEMWWEVIDLNPSPVKYLEEGGLGSIKQGNKCWRVNGTSLDLGECDVNDSRMRFYLHRHGDNANLYQIKHANNNITSHLCVRTNGDKLKLYECMGGAKSDKWALVNIRGNTVSFKADRISNKGCPQLVQNSLKLSFHQNCKDNKGGPGMSWTFVK